MARAQDSIVYFLLVYNLADHVLESQERFDDVDEAMAVYAKTEIDYLGRGYEIVLVGAESIETVKVTHGSYFGSDADVGAAAGLSYSIA